MAKKPPLLGIMILNRNGKPWLAPLFESLGRSGYASLRIYLVDNASDDGSVEMTLENFPEVTIIRMSQNMGYCMAYNMAMPYAFADRCEWVVWANNDVQLECGCLNELIRVARSDSRIGVVGPAFLEWNSDEPNEYMRGNHSNAIPPMRARSGQPINVEWVEGSFLMVSRKCLESVGPLDPYLYFYWEEADFCRRARYRGWRVVMVPNALARHYAGGWSNGDPNNKTTANQLQARNFYIYKLANPFGGFSTNLLAAFHLLLVQIKRNFPKDASSMQLHIKIFANVLKEIWSVYKKWKRDREGIHPPKTQGNFLIPKVEVFPVKRPFLL